MANHPANLKDNLGILVGGGPAPGINGVIGAITLEARTRARKVIGIYDGFQWLMQGDANHARELDHDDVSRVHFQGGSILNTSRANPTKKPEDLKRVVASLDKLGIGHLATIGGEKEDFRDDEKLRQLAQAASSAQHYCAPEQFRDRYQYLITDLRGCN